MLSQRLSPFITLRDSPLQLVAACGVGLLLGAVCVWFSPLWVLGALVGGALMLVAVKQPEIALLGILTATSSILFEDKLPLIPIGVGSLHVPDFILVASLGMIVVRWLVEPAFTIARTPLDWPLFGFFILALLSTLIAILGSSIGFNQGMREFRTVTYYLTFFIVTNSVRDERQLRLLLRGFFFLATLVAVAMVGQSLLGGSFRLLPGRVETLFTQGVGYSGITRVLPPGQSLILVAFVTTTVVLGIDRFRLINAPRLLQWGLFGLAVLLTFNRSFWIGSILAFLVLAYVVGGQERFKLIGRGLAIMLLGTIILVLVLGEPESQAARLVRASMERLATITSVDSVLSDSSLRWRDNEYGYALPQILSNPWIGLGFGARYRPWDPRLDWKTASGSGFDGRAYIHNGHVWILLKSGVLGYLCLAWLSLAFLARGFRYWRWIPDPEMQGIVLGFSLTYLAVLIGAVVNPMLMQWRWTPVIGMMMGTSEVVLKTIGASGKAGGYWER